MALGKLSRSSPLGTTRLREKVFRWRRLMSEGGKKTVCADDEDVVAAAEVHRLEERVRELERMLGRKTMEVDF